MGECNHNCSECGQDCSERTQSLKEKQNSMSNVKKVIGIVSGKGGVGKTLITSLMAVMTMRKGFTTAILDADITGPSIPKVFGIKEKAMANEAGIFPVETMLGTRLMSINLLLENENDPVVWRGPVIAGAVKQFWTDVVWGDVDYMFVDMPPGTGDVPLTVFQSLPIDGIIVVTSPQELVSMIVEKAVKMAQMMNIPILGIAENMAYYECPNCKERHKIFGQTNVKALAESFGIDTIAEIPIDNDLAALCDEGKIEWVKSNYVESLVQKLLTYEGTKIR